jgi:hypothetical protein
VAQERPRGPRAPDAGGRGSGRRWASAAPRAGPSPSRGPPAPPPSALLLSLAGRARHGAASPPMALRRSMGRPGLPPPPPPPPLPLLLAALASLLLLESAAAGRGRPGRRREAGGWRRGAAGGRRSKPGHRSPRDPGLGGPEIGVGGPALEGRRLGRSGCRLPDLPPGPPPPTFSRPGLFWRGGREREWGAGCVWHWVFPPGSSWLLAPSAQFWGPRSARLPAAHAKVPL